MTKTEINLNGFDSIKQPVILLKSVYEKDELIDYKIIYLNKSASNLFEIDHHEKKKLNLSEVLNNYKSNGLFQDLVDAADKKAFSQITSIGFEINLKYYVYNVQIIPSNDILLIFDKISSPGNIDYSETKAKSEIEIINTICRTVAASALNYSSVLKIISTLVSEYFDALCFIRLISTDKKKLKIASVSHYNEEIKFKARKFFNHYEQSINEGLNSYVIKNKTSLMIPELNEDILKQIPNPFKEYLISYNVKSIAVVPLIFEDKVIGTMNLARKKETKKFTFEDMHFLEEIAAIASISISNAALYKAKINEIAERKKTEKQLKSALEKLEATNKSLQDFAYVTSHDLQEPLRMVVSFTRLLEKRLNNNLDNDAKEFMHFIIDGTKRMQRMINDILTYSRIFSRGKPFAEVDLNEILDSVIADHGILILETKAEIEFETLPVINADETQMKQLFQNLIENSIKYRKENINPRIEISCEDNVNEYVFKVQDNGIGVDENSYERIFIMFQKLNDPEKYPGSGIGLSICKRIIERHNGRIWIESKLQKGTAVFFTIPKTNLKEDLS